MNLSTFDNFRSELQTRGDNLYREAKAVVKAKRNQLSQVTTTDVLKAVKSTGKITLVVLGVLAYLTYLAVRAVVSYGRYVRVLWVHHQVGEKIKRALVDFQDYYAEHPLSSRIGEVKGFYASIVTATKDTVKQALAKVRSELQAMHVESSSN